MTGKVIRKMDGKGFGFIKAEDGREFFFHMSAIKNLRFDDLKINQEVTFEESEGSKGLRAENVYSS